MGGKPDLHQHHPHKTQSLVQEVPSMGWHGPEDPICLTFSAQDHSQCTNTGLTMTVIQRNNQKTQRNKGCMKKDFGLHAECIWNCHQHHLDGRLGA